MRKFMFMAMMLAIVMSIGIVPTHAQDHNWSQLPSKQVIKPPSHSDLLMVAPDGGCFETKPNHDGEAERNAAVAAWKKRQPYGTAPEPQTWDFWVIEGNHVWCWSAN